MIRVTDIFCHFTDDPLYVTGGQPQRFDPESVEESFAQDGYRFGIPFIFRLFVFY